LKSIENQDLKIFLFFSLKQSIVMIIKAIKSLVINILKEITKAINEIISRKKLSSFNKRWWNNDFTKMKKKLNQVKNSYKKTRNNVDWKKWKKKCNEYNQKIKNTKFNIWKRFVEAADEKSIWFIKKYMNFKLIQYYISIINDTIITNEEKAA